MNDLNIPGKNPQINVDEQPGYSVPTVMRDYLATTNKRFGAWIIDMLLVAIFGATIGVIIGTGIAFNGIGAELVNPPVAKTDFLIRSLLGMLVIFGYYTFFYSTSGQTLGKKAFKIRVVKRNQSPLTLISGLKRALVLSASAVLSLGLIAITNYTDQASLDRTAILSSILSFLQFLNYLWAFWDKDNQALHDKFAGTLVVNDL